MALLILESARDRFTAEVPAAEWRLAIGIRPWGTGTTTMAAPNPHVPASQWSHRNDRNHAEPSPNPSLLAYYINEALTVITLPLMVRKGVRHNRYRRLFMELDAPLERAVRSRNGIQQAIL